MCSDNCQGSKDDTGCYDCNDCPYVPYREQKRKPDNHEESGKDGDNPTVADTK